MGGRRQQGASGAEVVRVGGSSKQPGVAGVCIAVEAVAAGGWRASGCPCRIPEVPYTI
jgi:hypothetical protein